MLSCAALLRNAHFAFDSMTPKPYNTSAKPTALPSETARRQSLSASKTGKKAIVFIDGSNWYHKLKNLLNLRPPLDFDVAHLQ